jgi:predicted nucleic acid-binding protein
MNAAEAVLCATEFEDLYQISFWDALIVKAAESAHCKVFYSEDFLNGQEYDGVLVIKSLRTVAKVS